MSVNGDDIDNDLICLSDNKENDIVSSDNSSQIPPEGVVVISEDDDDHKAHTSTFNDYDAGLQTPSTNTAPTSNAVAKFYQTVMQKFPVQQQSSSPPPDILAADRPDIGKNHESNGSSTSVITVLNEVLPDANQLSDIDDDEHAIIVLSSSSPSSTSLSNSSLTDGSEFDDDDDIRLSAEIDKAATAVVDDKDVAVVEDVDLCSRSSSSSSVVSIDDLTNDVASLVAVSAVNCTGDTHNDNNNKHDYSNIFDIISADCVASDVDVVDMQLLEKSVARGKEVRHKLISHAENRGKEVEDDWFSSYCNAQQPSSSSAPIIDVIAQQLAVKENLDLIAAVQSSIRQPAQRFLCLCAAGPVRHPAEQEGKVKCMARSSVFDISNGVIDCSQLSHSTSPLYYGCSLRCQYFMRLCATHIDLLLQHYCCPLCGLFCSVGRFMVCLESKTGVSHWFHQECMEKSADCRCPHCGSSNYRLLEIGVVDHSWQNHLQLALRQAKVRLIEKHQQYQQRLDSAAASIERQSEDVDFYRKQLSKIFRRQHEIPEKYLAFMPTQLEYQQLFVQLEKAATIGIDCDLLELHLLNALTTEPAVDFTTFLACLLQGANPAVRLGQGSGRNNNSALHVAVIRKHYLSVFTLILAEADLNARNTANLTPLTCAIIQDQPRILGLLLACGASLSIPDEQGRYPLHLAAISGRVEMAKLLMDTGEIGVNCRDEALWTPLHLACEKDNEVMVQYLIQNGANAWHRTLELATPLHLIAKLENVDIAWHLVNSVDRTETVGGNNLGVSYRRLYVNAVDQNGDSALHFAARYRSDRLDSSDDMIEFLVLNGGDQKLENKVGETPIGLFPVNNIRHTPIAFCIVRAIGDGVRKSCCSCSIDKTGAASKGQSFRIVCPDISYGKEQWPITAVNEFDQQLFDSNFTYITQLLVPNCVQNEHLLPLSLSLLTCCSCKDDCTTDWCECNVGNRYRYQYKDSICSLALPAKFRFDKYPLINECGDLCGCNAHKCQNRLAQKGVAIPLQVFKTVEKGWGVRAVSSISKGQYICEFLGEVIADDDDSFVQQEDDDSYQLEMLLSGEHKNKKLVINAKRFGNISRFINHSCNANANIVYVDYDQHLSGVNCPHICFFAKSDIKQGVEITWNYGATYWLKKGKSCECKQNCSNKEFDCIKSSPTESKDGDDDDAVEDTPSCSMNKHCFQ